MVTLAKPIFKLEQTVPKNDKIDSKSYLPRWSAVTSAVKDLSYNTRQIFVADFENGSLRFEGTIKIYVIHLRVHGKYYCDFTLHFIKIIEK